MKRQKMSKKKSRKNFRRGMIVNPKNNRVAPFTGAWIEIYQAIKRISAVQCRTLHGCVD